MLCGCNYDLYCDKRPYDYESSVWLSKDPSMFFLVDKESEEFYYPRGELMQGEETIEFVFFFVAETNILLCKAWKRNAKDEEYSFYSNCEFFPDRLIVKIDKASDTLFGGKYDKLEFIRMPIDTN